MSSGCQTRGGVSIPSSSEARRGLPRRASERSSDSTQRPLLARSRLTATSVLLSVSPAGLADGLALRATPPLAAIRPMAYGQFGSPARLPLGVGDWLSYVGRQATSSYGARTRSRRKLLHLQPGLQLRSLHARDQGAFQLTVVRAVARGAPRAAARGERDRVLDALAGAKAVGETGGKAVARAVLIDQRSGWARRVPGPELPSAACQRPPSRPPSRRQGVAAVSSRGPRRARAHRARCRRVRPLSPSRAGCRPGRVTTRTRAARASWTASGSPEVR